MNTVAHNGDAQKGPDPRRSFWTTRRKVGLVALVLVAISFVLGGYAALSARSHAQRAADAFSWIETHAADASTSSGRASIDAKLTVASTEAVAAHRALGSFGILRVAGAIPLLGREFTGAFQLVDDAGVTALNLKELLQTIDKVEHSPNQALFSTKSVSAIKQSLKNSENALRPTLRSTSFLYGPIRSSRVTYNRVARKLLANLNHASDVATIGTSLLGSGSTKHILVLAANNAEMRAQGAYLSYALLRTHDGAITEMQSGSVDDINLAAPLAHHAQTAQIFVDNNSTRLWSSVNLTSDFPWTGQTAAAMFKERTGIKVNAVLVADVPTLARLLQATGPIAYPGHAGQLTSSNANRILLHDLYLEYGNGLSTQRHELLGSIMATEFRRLALSNNRLQELKALASMIPGRHFLLWSGSHSVESAIARLGADGSITSKNPRSTFAVAVESDVAAKMDAYDIKVATHYDVTLFEDGSAWIETRVKVSNTAPLNLPAHSYLYGPDGNYAKQPGQYLGNVLLWSPHQSIVKEAVPDRGLLLHGAPVDLLPGKSETVSLWTRVPHAVRSGAFALHLICQPRLQATRTSLELHPGPFRTSGPLYLKFNLSSDRTLLWDTKL